MIDYKPFLVSNFRSGFNEALEPWLLPRDAFQVLQNSHLYRGVVEKINGYDIFTRMSYRSIVQLGVPDGITQSFTATLPNQITSNSFYAQAATNAGMTIAEIFTYSTDASSTVLNLVGSLGGSGTINISNPSAPVVNVIFAAPPPSVSLGGPPVQYNSVIFVYDGVPSYQPIMGIKPYYALNGTESVIVFDTRRAGQILPLSSGAIQDQLGMNYFIEELPHQVAVTGATVAPVPNAIATTFTGSFGGPVVPGQVVITCLTAGGVVVTKATDASATGALTGAGITSGEINYFTGNWTITYTVAPAVGNTFNTSAGEYGNVFTGNNSNFFSVANWQTLVSENANEENQNLLFATNNVDPVYYWNGTQLIKLNANGITRALFVVAYQGYLLLMAPVVNGVDQFNVIYWSAIEDPLNWTQDNFLPSPSSEPIRTQGQINNDLIVRFAKSERVFRFTQDVNSPFRWDGVNSIFPCDSSYGTINYDYYLTSIGKPAIVASDGRNVFRKDELIPDFTEPERIPQITPARFLDQTSIGQCYGERFDDIKEGWLCYTSDATAATSASIQPADSVLAFNYQDETYAVYTFPFSCLGFGTVTNGLTWGTDERKWGGIEDTWGDYTMENSGLVDLAGDQFGNVFLINDAYTLGPNRASVAITGVTNGNPTTITSTAHGLVTGDQIVIQGIVSVNNGLNFILNKIYVVTVVNANSFTIPVDTSFASAYTSGGTWFTAPVLLDVFTKNFTPFAEEGQLTRLGFVDILVSANNDTKIRVQFYKDDQLEIDGNNNPTNYYLEVPLTFSQTATNSTTNQTKVWKRIYCGAVAKEHTLRFYQNLADFTSSTLDQPVRIHAMCLYMKPAGRIFN